VWNHALVAQPTTVLESGTELAGFRIESLIGRGEMGTVYRATHVRIGRGVALKVLSPEWSEDSEFKERFIRESKVAASLYQPNVLPVYEVGEADGVLYVASRYVEGGDLGQRLQEKEPISPLLALEIGRQIALALGAAHSARLVHGDVKPANILLEGDEHAYIADFGLARNATRDYAAPEQLDGDSDVGGRADIYALGCVLYHCLAGQPPSAHGSELGVITAYLHNHPPAPQLAEVRPDLPPEVGAIVAKAMEKDPANRYSTAPQLAAALGAVLADLGGVEISPAQPSRERDTRPIAVAPTPLVAAEPPRSLPSRRRRVMLAALALALIAAAIAGVLAFGSTGSKPLHVPRVVGIPAGQAEALLRNAHFTPVIKQGPSDQFAQGLVYRAMPSPGVALQSGRPVTIWISTGKATYAVPDLVGASLSRAKRALAAAHLKLITKSMPSGKYKVGLIARQAPRRGGRLPAGGAMTLWVSTGPPRALVPDVRGESAQQATRDLRNAGFKVKNAGSYTPTSNYSLVGKVAGQSPVGVRARKKTAVTIYLYYYSVPQPTTTPTPAPTVTHPTTIGVT
jgi:serine/threonine-protein kinase